MNKNPFSFYDFLGYLFPGIIFLTLLVFAVALAKENAPIDEYFHINKFVSVFQEIQGLKWWETTIITIILSYVSGHLVAYLSSIFVEYLANTLFKYPSHYLLHKEPVGFRSIFRRYFMFSISLKVLKSLPKIFKKGSRNKRVCCSKINSGLFLYRALILLILLPVFFPLVFLGPVLKITNFVVRPLDDYVINSIQLKLIDLFKALNLSIPDVNSNADYHRIVMHYVYLNIPNCQRKADNYVAIYGFLRAMTLIACFYFDYLFILQLGTLDIQTDINWYAIKVLLAMGILCNVLFMGFVKFYRRFTLENYMALLTEK